MPNLRQTYLLLFSLYWAQGLPVGFMTHALPVILRAQGVSLAHIGGFGLLKTKDRGSLFALQQKKVLLVF